MPPERQAIAKQLQAAIELLQAASQMLDEEQPCLQALIQLNAAQLAVKMAGLQFMQVESEHCLQAIRENPNSEQRCQELVRLSHLYPLYMRIRSRSS